MVLNLHLQIIYLLRKAKEAQATFGALSAIGAGAAAQIAAEKKAAEDAAKAAQDAEDKKNQENNIKTNQQNVRKDDRQEEELAKLNGKDLSKLTEKDIANMNSADKQDLLAAIQNKLLSTSFELSIVKLLYQDKLNEIKNTLSNIGNTLYKTGEAMGDVAEAALVLKALAGLSRGRVTPQDTVVLERFLSTTVERMGMGNGMLQQLPDFVQNYGTPKGDNAGLNAFLSFAPVSAAVGYTKLSADYLARLAGYDSAVDMLDKLHPKPDAMKEWMKIKDEESK